jgi:hypothetical protein
MKRIITLFLALPLFLISCQKTPEAFFHIDSSDPEVGEKILFMNDSHNADRFEWDFGDGTISNDRSPIHIYTGTGTYTVTMIAISKHSLEDKATMTIDVKIPTLLEIEVREYYDQYVVPGASVILYSSVTDWDAQTGSISEGFTDADGITVFSNLDPFVYYVDVWEQNHDNYALKNEDIGFIRTPEILPHKINRFQAWVDYVQHTKGAAKGTRSVIIKKIERKAVDRFQLETDMGTEGWQKLYNRSVKLK